MNIKILLVDDESHVREALCRALRKEPYDVFGTRNAREALELLETHEFAVAIVDQSMPGMNGVDFLRHLRQRYPGVIRFMLTGHVNSTTAIEAINSGQVQRFFSKPCDSVELAVAIRQAIHQHTLVEAARQALVVALRNSYIISRMDPNDANLRKAIEDAREAIRHEHIPYEIENFLALLRSTLPKVEY